MRVGFIRTSNPCQPLRNFTGSDSAKVNKEPSKYELACQLLAAQHLRIAELEAQRSPKK